MEEFTVLWWEFSDPATLSSSLSWENGDITSHDQCVNVHNVKVVISLLFTLI